MKVVLSFFIIITAISSANIFAQDNHYHIDTASLNDRDENYKAYIRSLNLDDKELLSTARDLIYYRNYKHALLYLEVLQEVNPTEPISPLYVGRCYIELGDNEEEAHRYINAYIRSAEKVDYDAYFYLGRSYHIINKFDEALAAYNKYLELAHKSDLLYERAKLNVNMCHNAKEIINNPIDVTIENIGSTINSPYPEYVPVISADESLIIFTSRRPGSTGGLQDLRGYNDEVLGDYYEDIYYSIKKDGQWSQPQGIGSNINTNAQDANIGLSADGQQLFIYKSDGYEYGNIFKCKLYNGEWGDPEKLPYPINTRYWEGSISATSDGNMLFFASNRPDGYGGKDIYLIRKLPTGEWANPMNLGPTINTPYDDDAPFIHPDGITLYFSSEGHKSMGGFDIFKTVCEDELRFKEWSTPTNLGYPINTADNDIYFVLSASGERGYYASRKPDGLGDEDIYMIQMPESSRITSRPLTLLKGKILLNGTAEVPEDMVIEASNPKKNELVGIFKPSKLTGRYIIILPAGSDYKLVAKVDGYKAYERNLILSDQDEYLEINEDINLQQNQ